MAGEELPTASNGNRRALAAVLFMSGVNVAFDAMSTINSSPWTHETFSSPEKMAAGHEYVTQAIIVSTAFGFVGSSIGGSPAPLFGTLAANGYLYWLYRRAFKRGAG